ncbi:MAG: ribose 5-phosphate isomerase B [Chloroflexota bacterium]|nr:ribose 5-phosphate isomerase B [Chloroflexota bacterium]
MRVAIAGDHAGFPVKEELVTFLTEMGYDVDDLGAYHLDPLDDYPDFAKALANAITTKQVTKGILICGSGAGASIAANKVPGIRAATCHDTYSAHQGVEHDDMNVLCLGARIIGGEVARELSVVFLNATFSGEERHVRRLEKTLAIEREHRTD